MGMCERQTDGIAWWGAMSVETSGAAFRAAWIAALSGAALLAAQTALAGTDALTLRFVTAWGVTSGAALLAKRGRAPGRDLPPDAAALALGGLAGLSLLPAAWWAMDLADHLLRLGVGLLPLPALLSRDADRLLSLDLRRASYEAMVLFSVVLIPLAQSSLLWGSLRRGLGAALGSRRGVWAAAILGGGVLALGAPQQIEPALPSGLAALPGYLLVGAVAAWAAALGRSWWAGFVAHATFAYASLALRDDLLRAFGGKSYADPAWLSAILLGAFGVAVALQIIRYRAEPSGKTPVEQATSGKWPVLAAGIVLAAVIALAVIDVTRRG